MEDGNVIQEYFPFFMELIEGLLSHDIHRGSVAFHNIKSRLLDLTVANINIDEDEYKELMSNISEIYKLMNDLSIHITNKEPFWFGGTLDDIYKHFVNIQELIKRTNS